jgi:hypothetical protein
MEVADSPKVAPTNLLSFALMQPAIMTAPPLLKSDIQNIS